MNKRGVLGTFFLWFFGPRVGHVVACAALIVAIGLAFLVSVAVIPELHWKALSQSTVLHKQAALILRERVEIASRLDGVHIRYVGLLADDNPNTNLLSRRDGLYRLIIAEQANLSAADARLTELRATPNGAAAADDLQMALNSWTWISFSWATPGQLVLILTLLMGALGGVISVARAFLQPDDDSPPAPSDYVIRPLLGAVMAFIIYMLVQIGQIMLTIDGTDPLNPYPIALIAVVAGMMSAEAIAAIERWGKSLFGRVSGAPSGGATNEPDARLDAENDGAAEAGKTPRPPSAPGTIRHAQ